MLTELVVGALAAYPEFTVFMTVMGTARMVNKPLFTVIQKFVDSTETKVDNEWWANAQKHPAMRSFLWVLDWTASVKVPKGK